MEKTEKQYQSLNISASPGFATAQGRENERRNWSEETYNAKNREKGNRYDFSRRHLNFEIKRDDKIGVDENGKTIFSRRIIPLGSQSLSLKERYDKRLQKLNYKPFKDGSSNQPNTCIDFVFNGNHDRMTEIAFGKPMDLDWREDNSSLQLVDDPEHPGFKRIERMALDYYEFLCRHFGEENVIGFECHLDETTPHFHALVIPVTEMESVGKKGGYELDRDLTADMPSHITDMEYIQLSDDRCSLFSPVNGGDGFDLRIHITSRQYDRLPEVVRSFYRPADGYYRVNDNGSVVNDSNGKPVMITTLQYSKLSDDEKRRFRKADRMKVPMVSYSHYFGNTKYASRSSFKKWHTMLYNEVSKNWGLERGEDTSIMSAEERKQHRKKSKQKLEHERLNALEKLIEVEDKLLRQTEALSRIEYDIQGKGQTLTALEESIENAAKAKSQLYSQAEEAKNEYESIQKSIDQAKTKQKSALAEVDRLNSVLTLQQKELGVPSLAEMKFTIPDEIRLRLSSSLKDNQKIKSQMNFTIEDVWNATMEEIKKVEEREAYWKGDQFQKKQFNDIRAILTDMQTILFAVVDKDQKKRIADASKSFYLMEKKQLANSISKAAKYDELNKMGLSKEAYEEAVSKAEKLEATERVVDSLWPGLRKVKDILVNPELDSRRINKMERKEIEDDINKGGKESFKDIMKILDYSSAFKELSISTRASAIMIAAENGFSEFAKTGCRIFDESKAAALQLAEDLGEDVVKLTTNIALTATCLFFGYLDAATTVAESCGGGGGNNDLPHKKDDEDDLAFARRCLLMASKMLTPPRHLQNKQIKMHR